MTDDDSQTPASLASQLLADIRKTVRTRPVNAKTKASRRGWGRREATDYSGPGPDDRDPIELGDAVADLVNRRGWDSQTKVASVVGRWADVAGPDLASHVEPDTFDEESGLLRLKAESTAWATQVKLLVPQLLIRLDAEIGTGTVRQIEVSGPAAPARGYGKFRVPGRGPRDTYG